MASATKPQVTQNNVVTVPVQYESPEEYMRRRLVHYLFTTVEKERERDDALRRSEPEKNYYASLIDSLMGYVPDTFIPSEEHTQ